MNHRHIIPFLVAFLCIILLAVALILLVTPARAYEGEPVRTAKQAMLHNAADMLRWEGYSDDSPEIRALSAAWWTEQEALDIIAKTVAHEADPRWCEWEHSLAVAVVILNRVASPYFPNSVKDVVAAPGQYLEAYTRNFSETPRLCYEVAKAAMDGDHSIPEDCYWQAQFPQGREIWKVFELDTGYFQSTTYICRGVA